MGCTIWIDPLWCGVKGISQSDFLLNLKWFWGNPKWLGGRERQTQGGAPQFRRSILPSICSPALFVPTQERYVILCHGDKTTEVTQSHQNFSPSISLTQWWRPHRDHHPDEGVILIIIIIIIIRIIVIVIIIQMRVWLRIGRRRDIIWRHELGHRQPSTTTASLQASTPSSLKRYFFYYFYYFYYSYYFILPIASLQASTPSTDSTHCEHSAKNVDLAWSE